MTTEVSFSVRVLHGQDNRCVAGTVTTHNGILGSADMATQLHRLLGLPKAARHCYVCDRHNASRVVFGVMAPCGRNGSKDLYAAVICDDACGTQARRKMGIFALVTYGDANARCFWCCNNQTSELMGGTVCCATTCASHVCRQCGRREYGPKAYTRRCRMCPAYTCSDECSTAHYRACADDVD